jgi:hypothetical protein
MSMSVASARPPRVVLATVARVFAVLAPDAPVRDWADARARSDAAGLATRVVVLTTFATVFALPPALAPVVDPELGFFMLPTFSVVSFS